jgi:hypothetical protein
MTHYTQAPKNPKNGDTLTITGVGGVKQDLQYDGKTKAWVIPTDTSKNLHYGDYPALAGMGDLSDTTADKMWTKLTTKQGGYETARQLVIQMGGPDYGSNTGKIRSYLSSQVNTYGTYPGGVKYGIEAAGANAAGAGGNGSGGGGGGGGGTSAAQAAAEQQRQQSAIISVKDTLHQYGLDNLAGWAWNLISDPNLKESDTDIINQMRSTPEYAARFPGQAARTANGLAPLTETEYIAYENGAKELASQLPKDFMTSAEIGTLIGNNVSFSQLQNRINNGFNAVKNADPTVRQVLRDYYGVGPGHLAAYFLDTKRGWAAINRESQSAQIGAIGRETGFGDIGAKSAMTLAQQMLSDTSGATNLGTFRSGFEKIAPLTPLEQAQVGQRGQATVSQKQLLENAFGNTSKNSTAAGNASAIQLAEQARVAGLQGGGGFTQTTAGGVGVGRAGTEGQGK